MSILKQHLIDDNL